MSVYARRRRRPNCADDGVPLLCAIDIGITGRAWSTLRDGSTIAITAEEIVASRMGCAVAKTKNSGLC
jgi:hypothetical protein